MTTLTSAIQPESEHAPREDKRAWTAPSLKLLPFGKAETSTDGLTDTNSNLS